MRVADAALLARAFDEIEALARAGRDDDLVAAMKRLVPEFGAVDAPRPGDATRATS